MSTPTLLFAGFFSIGLLLMVAAVATRGKERRARYVVASGLRRNGEAPGKKSGGVPGRALELLEAGRERGIGFG